MLNPEGLVLNYVMVVQINRFGAF